MMHVFYKLISLTVTTCNEDLSTELANMNNPYSNVIHFGSDVSSNSCLPSLFVKMLSLKYMNLGVDNLKTFPSNYFKVLDGHTKLNITGQKLSTIGTCSVCDLSALKFLKMSGLRIEIIADGGFKGIHNLIGVNLSYNSLCELQSRHFEDLYSLEVLSLL